MICNYWLNCISSCKFIYHIHQSDELMNHSSYTMYLPPIVTPIIYIYIYIHSIHPLITPSTRGLSHTSQDRSELATVVTVVPPKKMPKRNTKNRYFTDIWPFSVSFLGVNQWLIHLNPIIYIYPDISDIVGYSKPMMFRLNTHQTTIRDDYGNFWWYFSAFPNLRTWRLSI